MKNSSFYTLAIAILTICSCQSDPKQKSGSSKKVQIDKMVSRTCYLSTYESDTLVLQLEQKASGKVTGKLLMKFPIMPTNDGTIEGKFVGDTLFVDYTFIAGSNKKKTFKNPLAFLQQGNILIMGVGVIETSFGRSYFARDKAINFARGKYHFNVTDCHK